MDSHVFRHFQFALRVLGIEPLKQKAMSSFWILFHFALQMLQVFVILKYREYIFFTDDNVGRFSDELKFAVNFTAYFTVIFSSWRNDKYHEEISCQFRRIESFLVKSHVNLNEVHLKCRRKLNVKIFLVVLFHSIGLLLELIFQSNEPQTMRFMMAFTFSLIVSYMKQLQGIFYIDLLNCYLKVLNHELLQMSELIKLNEHFLHDLKYNKFLIKRLKLLKSNYSTICDAYELEKHCFGTFFFANQINFYIQINSSLYWITFRLVNLGLNIAVRKLKI